MNRRAEPRIKKRISCELTVDEQRFRGLVLDLSRHGLFVQTAAKPDPGQQLVVVISAPGRKEPLVVEARVARTKVVPPHLRTVAQGGVGLHLADPPPDYLRFVEEVQRPVKIQKVSVLGDARESGGEEAGKRLTRDRLDRFFARRGARKPDSSPSPRPRPGTHALPRWRVQLRRIGGEGTRSFVLRCENEAEVREQAAAELGDDWKVEGVEKL